MNSNGYLKFPFADPEWVRKIIVGCAISIVPLLNLAVLGYFIECLRLGTGGRHILPEWNQWGRYFKDGFMALIISAVYLLIPILTLAFGLDGVIVYILAALFGLMVPFALAGYAVSRDLNQAFNPGALFNKMGQVLTYYLLSYIANFIVLTFAILVLLSTPMLAFLSALLVFYAGVVYWNYVGWLYYGN